MNVPFISGSGANLNYVPVTHGQLETSQFARNLAGKDAVMSQAMSVQHFFSTTEDETTPMPVQGQPMQRINMVRRAMRQYGHLLDRDTHKRIMAELSKSEGRMTG